MDRPTTRKLIGTLTKSEFADLCFNNFSEVHETFADGHDRGAHERALVEYVEKHEELVGLIRELHPNIVAELLGDNYATPSSLETEELRDTVLKEAERILDRCADTHQLLGQEMGDPNATTGEIIRHVFDTAKPLDSFVKLIVGCGKLETTHRKTLIELRDIVIALSLPTNHDLKIVRQINDRNTFIDVPTRQKRLVRYLLGRVRGVIPRESVADQSIFVTKRVDERIIGVHDVNRLEMPTPPEGGAADRDFVDDSIRGLATLFDIPWDEENDPPQHVGDIQNGLITLEGIQTFVCAFFSEAHSESEVAKLKKLFPQMDFVRRPSSEPSEYVDIKFKLDIIDGQLERDS